MAKKKSASAAANGNGSHAAAALPAKAAAEVAPAAPDAWDRKAEQLKALNTMLLKEATERRAQVAARLDELSADDAALAAAERAVARAALAAPRSPRSGRASPPSRSRSGARSRGRCSRRPPLRWRGRWS